MYLQSFSTDLKCYMELLLLYKRLTPIGDFFNYFNNLFFRNFSFRQIHCKCSKKETLLFTGASHVSATPLGHHLSMVSPTLLTYHMKVNSGVLE